MCGYICIGFIDFILKVTNLKKIIQNEKQRGNKKLFMNKINQNELISKKHKNVCKMLHYILHYIEHFFFLAFAVSRCISKSAFVSLLGIPIGITSSAIGFKIGAITTAFKKYKSIIKKQKKKQGKIVLLAQTKSNLNFYSFGRFKY